MRAPYLAGTQIPFRAMTSAIRNKRIPNHPSPLVNSLSAITACRVVSRSRLMEPNNPSTLSILELDIAKDTEAEINERELCLT